VFGFATGSIVKVGNKTLIATCASNLFYVESGNKKPYKNLEGFAFNQNSPN